LNALLPLLALIGACGPAMAHAHLKASVPDQGATLQAAPEHIVLTFSGPVELNFSSITITGPGKTTVKAGEASHGQEANTHVLEAPVTMSTTPGAYRVDWRVLSTDGHKMKGSYEFSIKP